MTDDKQSFEQEIRSAWSSIADVFGINFHPLYERLKEVDKIIADQAKRITELELTFKHIHSSIGTDGESCANCGLNIRDPIHERWQR